MSRSRKSTPYSGQRKNKWAKTQANRRLRKEVIKEDSKPLNYKQYRKNFCSYDICDYKTVGETFEEYYAHELNRWYEWQKYRWGKDEPYPTREQVWQDYQKYFLRK